MTSLPERIASADYCDTRDTPRRLADTERGNRRTLKRRRSNVHSMMVHHQTPPTRHGSTQAHDSQEDPHALPQWLDIAVSGDGLGLGLALWPPTPASPVSSAAVPIPISTSTPSLSSSRSPSSSSSLASSASSSVATTPVIQDDHAVSPVDLAIPSPDRMPSVSVANGPMGRLAAHTVSVIAGLTCLLAL